MAIIYVEVEDKYKPKTVDKDIEVAVTVGDAQTGAYMIFLEKKLKGANKSAKMGKAADVIGKRTIVSATVVDKLDETNWTSLTITITEGTNSTKYGPYSKQVAQNYDTVSYIIQIHNTNE
jgi:hypothetical protein